MRRLPEEVTTPRLTLRLWRSDDAEALGEAIGASVEHLRPWMAWAAHEPMPLEDRRALIEGWEGEWSAGGDAVFGAFHGGTVVGGCGLHRRLGPGVLEIGYWVHVDFTRQGFATELAAGLTSLAFTVDGIEQVEIHHDRANAASAGVPRRLGFRLLGERADEVAAPGEEGIERRWAVTRQQWTAEASAPTASGAGENGAEPCDL